MKGKVNKNATKRTEPKRGDKISFRNAPKFLNHSLPLIWIDVLECLRRADGTGR